MSVLLPNDGWIEMDIDLGRFKLDREINGIQYGWYSGTYIGIKIIK